jgi:hypothetical protein
MRFFQGAFIEDEPDPVRRIAKGILATLEFIVRNGYVFALLDHFTTNARLRTERLDSDRVHVLDTMRHLEQAMEREAIRRTEPEHLARAIGGVVDRMARAYFATKDADLDALTQEAIDFCIGGATGPRTIEVAELRAEIRLTPELLDLRDRVGAGTRDGERESAASAPAGRR